jgi:hypothetical protein
MKCGLRKPIGFGVLFGPGAAQLMKTDSLFYRLFHDLPRLLFDFIARGGSAGEYGVRRQRRRYGGLPPNVAPSLPITAHSQSGVAAAAVQRRITSSPFLRILPTIPL